MLGSCAGSSALSPPFTSRRLRVLGCHPILIVEGSHICNLAASIARKGKPGEGRRSRVASRIDLFLPAASGILAVQLTMGRSRRFLNLIVDNRILGAKSLRCIDLTHHKYQLFNTSTPNGSLLKNKRATSATFKMGSISLPSPSFKMGASASDLKDQRMHCFPAADRRVFSLDQSGRGLLLEADTSRLVILPRLHKPKLEPISLYIPCADDSGEDLDGGGSGGGSLFIMDRIARPEVKAAPLFEALIYHSACSSVLSKSWHGKLLPLPPPYILGKTSRHSCLEISSYTVLKGGSQICISVNGVGTYCLDTASYEWSEVGEWMLPFQGKVEYVPELELWFGFSASKDHHLAAADLSTMDSSQPQLLDSWKEIDDDVTQGWQQIQDPQLVNLGSGRLCIARFLHTGTPNCGSGNESSGQNVTVLTGVDVAISYHFGRKMSLEMVKHKSRCHKSSCSEDTITAVL